MTIVIETSKTDPRITRTSISDGKNSLSITEERKALETTTTIQSNGDSIYPIMDLLKILEMVG